MKNYYEILEVNEKASQEIISKVFKLHIKKWHPDLYQGDAKIEAENKTKEINEAYSTLSDEKKRAEYDVELLMQKEINSENYELETLREENEMLKKNIEKKDMIINNLINPSSNTAKKMQQFYYDEYYAPQEEYIEDNENYNEYHNFKKGSLKDFIIKIFLCFIMLVLGSIIIYLLIDSSYLMNLLFK